MWTLVAAELDARRQTQDTRRRPKFQIITQGKGDASLYRKAAKFAKVIKHSSSKRQGKQAHHFLHAWFTKSSVQAQAALYRHPLVTAKQREILRC